MLAGGIKRVGGLCELLVPAMALLFIGGGLAVIAVNWQAVPGAYLDRLPLALLRWRPP